MYLKELNEKQLEATKAIDGYIRVIAGAGTGKTRVLTSRYLYLVKEMNIDTDNILCMTFTRKAMNEMKDRIRKELSDTCSLKYIQTYHSFGSLFLKEEIKVLGYLHGFKIYDEIDQKRILKDLYKKRDIELDDMLLQDIKDIIYREKKKEIYINRMYDHSYTNHILDNIRTLEETIIDEYLLRQRKDRWLDFSDLILYTHYILKNYEEIKEKWQSRFLYIEVDEAQDTSPIENDIIEILASKCKNLFVVGDPDQNIYEWRESDNKILLSFDKMHKNCKTFTLEKNYRSTSNIIEISNNLIKHNKKRIDKTLYTVKGKGKEVEHKTYYDSNIEAIELVKTIQKEKEEGINYKEMAILYRCNYQSKDVENALKENSIPYHIIGGTSFYSLTEIKDLISLIKLYLFEDDESFIRMTNKPSRKFSKKKIEYLESIRGNNSLLKALSINRNDEEFSSSDVFYFVDLLKRIKDNEHEWGLAKVINNLYEESGYHDYLEGLKNKSHLENATAFIQDIREFALAHIEFTLEDYFHLYLENIDETRKDYDCVYLMTVHAAKGLEFNSVHVIGLNEMLFPHKHALETNDKDAIEEERRLLYVAITRAKENLYLYSENTGHTNFTFSYAQSRFIKELFDKNYVEEKMIETKHIKKKKVKMEKAKKERKPKKTKMEKKSKGILTSLFEDFKDENSTR